MSKLRSCTKAGIFLALWAVTAVALSAQTFQTLHRFKYTDGEYPWTPLVQASDGNLYGTVSTGGNPSCTPGGYSTGCGTVFQITPGGKLTTIFSFDETNGSAPYAGLVQTANGDFYGATQEGGTGNGGGACSQGCGTVFTITASGTLTTLYNFNYTDGAGPTGALILGTDGNYYGTTSGGGAADAGTFFVITPSGTLTTLYTFTGRDDGANPYGSLIQTLDGNFYGTAWEGGANGFGTVFTITANGTLTTLHAFDNSDGSYPYAGLVEGNGGDFYGVTEEGGTNSYGTVFKISPRGKLTTLYSFSGGVDGDTPISTLIQATDGNFYGTASYAGLYNLGTVFQITKGGTLTTVHSFGTTEGWIPYGPLVQATNGGFYGTTFSGGGSGACPYDYGCGTIFSLSVGLDPFVKTVPTSGNVGAAVRILGTNLNGATSVTFNGTAATFAVISKSEIETSVPPGATAGWVRVTTTVKKIKNTLKSNVAFQVTQ
ncbi:MAG: choice-of-anchor tandem repeat GloVer-containing protein [Candidatus Sulfotelmatobacter sp.]